MKEKIVAVCLLILVIGFVSINTIILGKEIDELYESTKKMNISKSDIASSERAARELYQDFKNREAFISLTVNHEDLTSIEESFSEIIGYLSVGDADGARVIKNRLLDSLEHLRRLSGFNIDSII